MLFFEKKKEQNRTLIEQIILEKYNQYYRLAYSYVHNKDDADDIVQNGAYKALKNSCTLNNPEFVQTWVYRIMLNECFRCLKQSRPLSFEAVQNEHGEKMSHIEDKYPDIDLQRALEALSPKDKAVVILRYFEDKKLEEIANILEENISTVKSRLYRSLKKLHAALSDEAM